MKVNPNAEEADLVRNWRRDLLLGVSDCFMRVCETL